MNWVLDILKNKYVKFDGRAGRPEYWYFFLFNIVVGVIFGIIGGVSGGPTLIDVLYFLFVLAVLLPGIAVTIRRLHDQDRSGWFILLAFIPIVGGIILLIFMVLPGSSGDNRFGPPAPTSPGT
jgi:uncharacterized membrane protein YhaH (DUF805 family)